VLTEKIATDYLSHNGPQPGPGHAAPGGAQDTPLPVNLDLAPDGKRAVGKAGDVCVDLFGGSDSTMIGCERRGRNARLMEIDPKYTDVAVLRWQQFTGKEATLEGDDRTFAEVARSRSAAVPSGDPVDAEPTA